MSGSKIKSLLDELDHMIPNRDKYTVLEARVHHFITSGINILKQIEENFTPEEADVLTRRLFNSLQGKDPVKFQRKIRQLREEKEEGIDE